MQPQRALAVLIVVFSCLGGSVGEVISAKKVGGKTIMCMHTGLMSGINDCGLRSNWYAYVFVGSVSAITSIEGDEKEIQITPEEVFNGEPANPLTVRTSQGACLPEMAVGDHWLFFLRKEKGKPIVLDYYGNDSLPVADAKEQIETLRRLQSIGNFAILRGQVLRGAFYDGKPVPGAHVVARRASDHVKFTATTSADGRYEFEPLPPGEYKLTVDRIGSFRPDKEEIEVSRSACWDLTLSRN